MLRCLGDGLFLAILLIAMFLAMAPTPTYAQGPEITITPASGVSGSKVTIRGTGFPSYSTFVYTVDIRIDGIYLIRGIQTTNGTFEVVVEIPSLPPGEKVVTAVSDTGQVLATNHFTVQPPPTPIPLPPVPRGGIPPWIWPIPPTIIVAGAGGYSLKRWMDTRRIKVHLYKDNTGTQQIESGAPVHSDSEIGLRPVLDPGQQSIETEDSSVIDERRERP